MKIMECFSEIKKISWNHLWQELHGFYSLLGVYTSPLLLKVCPHTRYTPLTHLQTFSIFMAFINKNQHNQCHIILHSSLLDPTCSSAEKGKKKKKKVILLSFLLSSLTVWSFTVTSSTFFQMKTNPIILILLPWLFIDYRNIAMTFIKEKGGEGGEKKSQNVSSCIKPVHFCIYSEGTSMYMLHTVTLWQTQTWGSFHPFWWVMFEKRCWSPPKAGMGRLPLPGHLRDTVHVDRLTDRRVWNSCVLGGLTLVQLFLAEWSSSSI